MLIGASPESSHKSSMMRFTEVGNGVVLRMTASGEKPVEAARQVSGSSYDPAYDRRWVENGPIVRIASKLRWLMKRVADYAGS
jgi:hypothetical protein